MVRFQLRMSEELMNGLREEAEVGGRSLNAQIVWRLSNGGTYGSSGEGKVDGKVGTDDGARLEDTEVSGDEAGGLSKEPDLLPVRRDVQEARDRGALGARSVAQSGSGGVGGGEQKGGAGKRKGEGPSASEMIAMRPSEAMRAMRERRYGK